MHRSKMYLYSITLSACESSVGGIVRPSVFAVLRLMTNSNLVGSSTGRSTGLVPLRILSTYAPARRNMASELGAYVINPPDSTMLELNTIVGSLRIRANSAIRARALKNKPSGCTIIPVSYTHLRAHETRHEIVCRL